MGVRDRIVKRFRRIAVKNNLTYNEVLLAYKSQFLFAKETIEKFSTQELSEMTEEELEDYVFNFIYIGKIHTSRKLQELGNKRNKIRGEYEDNKKRGD